MQCAVLTLQLQNQGLFPSTHADTLFAVKLHEQRAPRALWVEHVSRLQVSLVLRFTASCT